MASVRPSIRLPIRVRLVRQCRGMSTVTGGIVEQGPKEAGKWGRVSVSGITASVFGGTGFLGRYLMTELGKSGYRAYLANRGDTEDARATKLAFDLGNWAQIPYSPRDEDSIRRCMEGADVVINLIGKHYDTKHIVPIRRADGKLSRINYSLEETHIEVPARLAEIAKSMGVPRFIHISALGAREDSDIRWLRTKAKGEVAVKSAFPNANIVRPGRLFGNEDRLLNWFAVTAKTLGMVPLINGGDAVLQMTYVYDVAEAICKIIEDDDLDGQTFELAGETTFTWRELADFVFDVTYQKPSVIDLPLPVAEAIAGVIGKLPNPLITVDDVKLMAEDMVLDPRSTALTLSDLYIKPTPVEKVAFNYLHRFREGGHFPYSAGYH